MKNGLFDQLKCNQNIHSPATERICQGDQTPDGEIHDEERPDQLEFCTYQRHVLWPDPYPNQAAKS